MSNLRVEPSLEEDIHRLMALVLTAFEHMPFCRLVGDTSSPENLEKAGQRHLRTWREHAAVSDLPVSIKCIHTDPATSQETIISTASWFIYTRPRTDEEYTKPNYLLSCDWVEDEEARRKAQAWRKPALDNRIRWMGGKPHGVLMYMATDPAFLRQGAATMCVQWGLERCKELDIPAVLEASQQGLPMYQKLGFELMEAREIDDAITGKPRPLRFMVAWPPGTEQENKKPVFPEYGLE